MGIHELVYTTLVQSAIYNVSHGNYELAYHLLIAYMNYLNKPAKEYENMRVNKVPIDSIVMRLIKAVHEGLQNKLEEYRLASIEE